MRGFLQGGEGVAHPASARYAAPSIKKRSQTLQRLTHGTRTHALDHQTRRHPAATLPAKSTTSSRKPALRIIATPPPAPHPGPGPKLFTRCTPRAPSSKTLVSFMISGPGGGAGAGRRSRHPAKPRHHGRHRPPKKPTPETIRADFAESIEANSVHGSDSPEAAAQEISYFFARH